MAGSGNFDVTEVSRIAHSVPCFVEILSVVQISEIGSNIEYDEAAYWACIGARLTTGQTKLNHCYKWDYAICAALHATKFPAANPHCRIHITLLLSVMHIRQSLHI